MACGTDVGNGCGGGQNSMDPLRKSRDRAALLDKLEKAEKGNGLCLEFGNLGCSGTIRSNIDSIISNYSYIHDPQLWAQLNTFFNEWAVRFAYAAFTTSAIGAGMELGATGAGLVSGGAAGGVAGFAAGNGLHLGTTNPIESALSGLSFLFTAAADYSGGSIYTTYTNGVRNYHLPDTTVTSAVLTAAGTGVAFGTLDVAIDYAGLSYATNPTNGVVARLNLEGQTLNLGVLMITFGR